MLRYFLVSLPLLFADWYEIAKHDRSHNFLVLAFLPIAFTSAEDVVLPAKDKLHIFLLIGQSNMAGRGIVEVQDKTAHSRVLMLSKENKWVPAVDPMHFDKPAAGVGLGKTFGEVVADATQGVTIGFVPCAVGGSPIDSWKPGAFHAATQSHPWDDAMKRIHVALQSGTLHGVLWHQGESDSTPELAETYEVKLHDLISRLRKELDAPRVPFIVGQMGRFSDESWTDDRRRVDAAHQALPAKVPQTAFVSAEGLVHNGDKVHFDAASYRELGKRYADQYLRITSSGDSKEK